MLCCEPGWFLYSSLTAFALFAHSTCVVARSNQGCRRERTKELVGDGMDALRAGRTWCCVFQFHRCKAFLLVSLFRFVMHGLRRRKSAPA
jgi:hypothetical protein